MIHTHMLNQDQKPYIITHVVYTFDEIVQM